MDFQLVETGIFSIIPPIIAISLALITKEVYSSLFLGLLSGVIIYGFASGGSFLSVITDMFDMISHKIADNSYMIIFLALLWAVVVLITKSGGSEAFGRWVSKRLKNKKSTCISTFILGLLVFIDDGFNCLTVGTVMKPVFDRNKIAPEKLAYIIDATAAPVCIIAPVSSWAVAIASEISSKNGFNIFLSTISYNFYAVLTIVMVIIISLSGKDFGPMKKAEKRSEKFVSENVTENVTGNKGRVFDLVIPISVLIIFSILGMGYVGGFFKGVPFSLAIGENPTAGLTLGAFAALISAALLYIPRKIIKPKDFSKSIVKGIGSIIPPLMILILSWSLSGVCREMIGTGVFISDFVEKINLSCRFLPFIIFIVSALMSFSMGSSWGTFSILIPIVTMICSAGKNSMYLIPSLGATLAGSVFGDHCSPISDTTILSSAGAQCDHIKHVETQLPYAVLVAVISAVGYLLVGFSVNIPVAAAVCLILLVSAIFLFSKKS